MGSADNILPIGKGEAYLDEKHDIQGLKKICSKLGISSSHQYKAQLCRRIANHIRYKCLRDGNKKKKQQVTKYVYQPIRVEQKYVLEMPKTTHPLLQLRTLPNGEQYRFDEKGGECILLQEISSSYFAHYVKFIIFFWPL